MQNTSFFVGFSDKHKGQNKPDHLTYLTDVEAKDKMQKRDFVLADLTFQATSEIEKSKTKTSVFFITSKAMDVVAVAAQTKQKFPDTKVVLCGPDLPFKMGIEALKHDRVDLFIRSDDMDYVQKQMALEETGRHMLSSRCYWKDETGIIQWNRSDKRYEGQKKKTLLVLMPAWNNDYAPLGLAYISAALKEQNFPTDVLDLNCSFWHQMKKENVDASKFRDILIWRDKQKYAEQARGHLNEFFQKLEETLLQDDYAHVGFSLFSTNLRATEEACELIRKLRPNIKIFCGGPSCNKGHAHYLITKKLINAGVFGEGEVSTINLLKKWHEGKLGPVAGTWLRDDNNNVFKEANRPLADFNSLPLPDFSGFDIYNYDLWQLPITFSRGCVAKCTFCAETKFWVRFRILKAERVLEMVEANINLHGIRAFSFNDSLVNGSDKYLEKFADQVIERKLNISFGGYCRLEDHLTPEYLKKLALAGCRTLSFGMETGSQKVADLMKKEYNVKNYAPIIHAANAAGIKVWCCVIIGFPGEFWKDFFKTVWALVRMHKSIWHLNINILSPMQMGIVPDEMYRLGIKPGPMGIDSWTTVDGRNTPRVRLIRYWIIVKLWNFLKREEKAAPISWYHGSRKNNKKRVFLEA